MMGKAGLETSPLIIINRRYILQKELGAGGMGTVYQAVDRLTGQSVALKQLTQPGSRTSKSLELALSLAREFKVLATLRHPHIINVLDYGFDEQFQPFFTMHLLEKPQTILDSGRYRPQEEQIALLLQLLQALDYLYRRGIIHRDLKPANILGVNNQVKLLDFGLSISSTGNQSATTAGTIAYMAPEVIMDGAASQQSDLYAVGVIAYELLAGRPPFRQERLETMLFDTIHTSPDVASIGLGPELAAVLVCLLAKQPEGRYQRVSQLIQALCAATGRPLPGETTEIRESFLQAAQFVGRQTEMAQLIAARDGVEEDKGSLWLVGGERGVGKSRLLDELRTLALGEGAIVLRGHSVQEGGKPYQLWLDVLRWLVLTINLTIEEASAARRKYADRLIDLG
jgi:serine/threonine protein kinase